MVVFNNMKLDFARLFLAIASVRQSVIILILRKGSESVQ